MNEAGDDYEGFGNPLGPWLAAVIFVLFCDDVAWSYTGSWEGWSGAHAMICDIKMYLTAAFPPSSLSRKHQGWLAGSKFHCLWSYLGRQALAILEIKTFLWPDRQSYFGPVLDPHLTIRVPNNNWLWPFQSLKSIPEEDIWLYHVCQGKDIISYKILAGLLHRLSFPPLVQWTITGGRWVQLCPWWGWLG